MVWNTESSYAPEVTFVFPIGTDGNYPNVSSVTIWVTGNGTYDPFLVFFDGKPAGASEFLPLQVKQA